PAEIAILRFGGRGLSLLQMKEVAQAETDGAKTACEKQIAARRAGAELFGRAEDTQHESSSPQSHSAEHSLPERRRVGTRIVLPLRPAPRAPQGARRAGSLVSAATDWPTLVVRPA